MPSLVAGASSRTLSPILIIFSLKRSSNLVFREIYIRKLTVSASPKNFQEALEIAQKAEKLLAGSREIKEISKISEVQVSSIKHRNSRKESRSPTHAERARHSSKSFSPYRNYKQERATTPYRRQDSPTRKCYNCERIQKAETRRLKWKR